jgi:hypothetical protein
MGAEQLAVNLVVADVVHAERDDMGTVKEPKIF